MGCMKNLFNAASSLTALGNTFDKTGQYRNLTEMHQKLLETIQQNKVPTKGSHQTHTDDSDSDYVDKGKSKDKEVKEEIDDSSTDTEQLSGSTSVKVHCHTTFFDD